MTTHRSGPMTTHRWLAYYLPDGAAVTECRERSQARAFLQVRASEGCKVVGIFKTADEASAAVRPVPSQEEQSAEIVAGLAASIVNETLRKKRCA